MPREYIVGIGESEIGKLGKDVPSLMVDSLEAALEDLNLGAPPSGRLSSRAIAALLTCSPVVDGGFMFGHKAAALMGLAPRDDGQPFYAKCIDVGGSGPISCIIEATRILRDKTIPLALENNAPGLICVSVGDAVGSLPIKKLLRIMLNASNGANETKPVPLLYDEIAQWHAEKFGTTRSQFAMVSSLISYHAANTPKALSKKALSVEEVINSRQIGVMTSLRECAYRSDGAASILIASEEFLKMHPWLKSRSVEIVGRGESSNIIDFRKDPIPISENSFCLKGAYESAFSEAKRISCAIPSNFSVHDFDFYAIYDCFPIAFLKAIEDIGLCPTGKAGKWIEDIYETFTHFIKEGNYSNEDLERKLIQLFPFNTHGGLMHYAAPWECPAAYNVIESVKQLRGSVETPQKQINFKGGKGFALVTGNGGVFSSAAVLILAHSQLKKSHL